MMALSAPRSRSYGSVYAALLTIFVFSISTNKVDAQAYQERAVQCPSDQRLTGYVSIADLNNDILQEIRNIESSPLFEVRERYEFYLCPQTTFDGSDSLTPLLNNSYFICGRDGSRGNNCIVSGGELQVNILDVSFTEFEYSKFQGITFTDAERIGIGAAGPVGTIADFEDCLWKDNSGEASIQVLFIPAEPLGGRSLAVGSHGNNPIMGAPNWYEEAPTRKLQELRPSMTVRLENCTFQDGFSTPPLSYAAIFSAGDVEMRNVEFLRNEGSHLISALIGGTTIMESATLFQNDVISVSRAADESILIVRDANYIQNDARASVLVINANATVSTSGFLNNFSPTGADILAFNSSVDVTTSCFVGTTAGVAPILSNSESTITATDSFGSNTTIVNNDNFCPLGVLNEMNGSDCLFGDPCFGECVNLTASVCPLGQIMAPPTLMPSSFPSSAPSLSPSMSPSSISMSPSVPLSTSPPTSSGASLAKKVAGALLYPALLLWCS